MECMQVLPSSYLAESLFGSLYLFGRQAASTGLNLSSLATDLPNLVSLFVLGQVSMFAINILSTRSDVTFSRRD